MRTFREGGEGVGKDAKRRWRGGAIVGEDELVQGESEAWKQGERRCGRDHVGRRRGDELKRPR
jgi:hypothetical protein